jgi:hypothetical protein
LRDHNRATAGELFKMMTDINMVHVPYRSELPAGGGREIV